MLRLLAALALVAGASAASAQSISFVDLPAVEQSDQTLGFKPSTMIGARVGFAMATDAEEAVPFIGVGARFPIASMAAVEITFDLWRDKYAGGDLEVSHAPLMFTGMLYFPLEIPTTAPYIFAGVGFHTLDFKYSGALSGETDDRDTEFGFHGGAGLELTLLKFLKVYMDVRWIYIDPDPAAAAVEEEDFDTVQFSFSLNIAF
jgi:opacity protein-like surface antigen